MDQTIIEILLKFIVIEENLKNMKIMVIELLGGHIICS